MAVPPECEGYLVFGTFRDPVARAISLWRYHWRNDGEDRLPLGEYLDALPGLHEYHARSQSSWYEQAGASLFIPVDDRLEQSILEWVFHRRGFDPYFPNPLGRLNVTESRQREDSLAVARKVAITWPDDWRQWATLGPLPTAGQSSRSEWASCASIAAR